MYYRNGSFEINVPYITYKSNAMIIWPVLRARCVDFLFEDGKSILESDSGCSQEWNTGFCLITCKGSAKWSRFYVLISLLSTVESGKLCVKLHSSVSERWAPPAHVLCEKGSIETRTLINIFFCVCSQFRSNTNVNY